MNSVLDLFGQNDRKRHDFPQLLTHIKHPNNLPPQLTSFVGREAEIAAVCERLLEPNVRLLTLTGVGGIGKTRLSLQVGQQLLDAFPDGVFFIPLAAVREVHLVIPTIAETVGLRESPGHSYFDLLNEYFAHKCLLLILDNFEQVLDAGPELDELLVAAPNLKILVTSRILLRLAPEHDHPVYPLSQPDTKACVSMDIFEANEAVQLFVQRARAVKPDYRLNKENAVALAEICNRLDGLPLAIELAAARCRLLTPLKILGQLDNRLRVLVGGARDLPERHQTMRAAIDWSYELLSAEEQILFRRLSVFAGGSYLEAAESVCGFDDNDVMHRIESLLDKNLLRRLEVNGEPRFSMFETIREYGLEQLEAARESQALFKRYADFFVKLFRRYSGDYEFWKLDIELDNLRSVLRWSVDSDQADVGFSIMENFFYWGDHNTEGRRWAESLLSLPSAQVKTESRFNTLYSDAYLAYFQGDLMGFRSRIDELLELSKDLCDPWFYSIINFPIGSALLYEGDFEGAYRSFNVVLNIALEEKELIVAGYTKYALAETMLLMGEYDRANEYLIYALDLFNKKNQRFGAMETRIKMGYVALEKLDYTQAKGLFQEGLHSAQMISTRRRLVGSIRGFAGVSLGIGDLARSARLFGAAEAMVKISGSRYSQPDEEAIDGRNLASLRALLEEEKFAVAWREGMQMDLEEAIAYALEEW